MILTYEIFEKGRSSNNGYNMSQLKALGLTEFKKGWKRLLLGKEYPSEAINLFLELKDNHFKNPEAIKKRKDTFFVDCPWDIPRAEQYKHPNWQRMRLMVLKRDGFKCVDCKGLNKTLHVHHLKYSKHGKVWEVPIWYLVTLCEDCHSKEHGRDLTI